MGSKNEINTFINSKLYTQSIDKGIVFQFLTTPSLELSDINNNINNNEKIKISFNDRINFILKNMSQECKNYFHNLFEK